MLDNNTNKVVWVGVAVGLVAAVGVSALSLYPQAFSGMKDTINESMTTFIKPSDEKNPSLEVKIPNSTVPNSLSSYYEYSSLSQNDDGTWFHSNNSPWPFKSPIFSPNEFDDVMNRGATDKWNRTFNYPNGVQAWVDNLKNDENLKDHNGGSIPADALVSPFKATDSKGNDITKNIRFKSLKITKLDTVDNKTISTDTPDVTVNDKPVKGIQFNHEYTDYGELLDAIYIYAENNYVESDGDYEKYYVQKAYFTATYTVHDSDGNSTKQSASFTVTDEPFYDNIDPM